MVTCCEDCAGASLDGGGGGFEDGAGGAAEDGAGAGTTIVLTASNPTAVASHPSTESGNELTQAGRALSVMSFAMTRSPDASFVDNSWIIDGGSAVSSTFNTDALSFRQRGLELMYQE